MKEYYALCAKFEEDEDYEVAPLHLGENELGTVLRLPSIPLKMAPTKERTSSSTRGIP